MKFCLLCQFGTRKECFRKFIEERFCVSSRLCHDRVGGSSIHGGDTARQHIAQEVATKLDRGVSASVTERHILGTDAFDKYQAALFADDATSVQIANQRDLPALTVSYAAQTISSGASRAA